MIIYTDGSCSGNLGKGAWGFLIVKDKGRTSVIKASVEDNTTNNRMELTAIIEAVKYASRHSTDVDIYSDSMYCINCFNNWKKIWWKDKERRDEAKNSDLWNEMFSLYRDASFTNFKLHYVKGHSGDKFNSMIDKVVQGLNKE